jgi:hypothetical protein
VTKRLQAVNGQNRNVTALLQRFECHEKAPKEENIVLFMA